MATKAQRTLWGLIDRAGGQTKFARLYGMPLRTVQDWAGGRRRPPRWLPPLLEAVDLLRRWKDGIDSRPDNSR